MHSETMRPRLGYQQSLSSRQFRLLSIHAAAYDDQPLECTLSSFNLQEAPPYEAVSYVWGSPDNKAEIICNDHSFMATLNLFQALRRLRLPNAVRTIWADAICINQDDLAERRHQVCLMGQIYENAEKVVVWLGPSSEDAPAAITSLHIIHDACIGHETEWIESQEESWDGKTPDAGNSKGYNFYRNVSLPTLVYEGLAWGALKTLYNCPWFTRIWCVQEIRLSSSAVFFWGRHELRWSEIGITAAWLEDKHTVNDFLPGTFPEEISFVQAFRMYDREWVSESLLDTLIHFRTFEATDARDRVFGLLNLVEPIEERNAVEVSYEKPVKEVYANVARAIIRLTSSLSVLSLVEHPASYMDKDEHYSWSPRWDDSQTRILSLNNRFGTSTWATCDDEPLRDLDQCRVDRMDPSELHALPEIDDVSPSSGNLRLSGISYARITSVRGAMDDVELRELVVPGKTHPFLTWWNEVLAMHTPGSIEGVDAMTDMALTLSAGWDESYNLICNEEDEDRLRYYSDYLALIDHLFNITGQDNITEFDPLSMALFDGKKEKFESIALKVCDQRRLFKLENGSFGIGPACIRQGDVVVVLFGGDTPYVLRGVGGGYRFMGQAYVQDLIFGQLVREWREGRVKMQDFILN